MCVCACDAFMYVGNVCVYVRKCDSMYGIEMYVFMYVCNVCVHVCGVCSVSVYMT